MGDRFDVKCTLRVSLRSIPVDVDIVLLSFTRNHLYITQYVKCTVAFGCYSWFFLSLFDVYCWHFSFRLFCACGFMFWHLTSMFGSVHKKTSLRHFLLFYFTFFYLVVLPFLFFYFFEWFCFPVLYFFFLLSSCISIWYRFCLMFRLLWHNNFPNVEIVKVYPVLSLFSIETWYLHRYTSCLFKIGKSAQIL